MNSLKTIPFILFGIFLIPSSALADSFRCPSSGRLIHEGETQGEILSKCGEPDFVTQASSLFLKINRFETREVAVEEWTYDFGPNRFLQILRFEGGRLKEFEHGGYGRRR